MNAERHLRLGELLIDLEAALRSQRLWDALEPPASALASTQPFCVDTLSFPQWLQFVFLPRMHALVAQRSPLPDKCGITPMAELHFAGIASGEGENSAVGVLRAIDAIFDS